MLVLLGDHVDAGSSHLLIMLAENFLQATHGIDLAPSVVDIRQSFLVFSNGRASCRGHSPVLSFIHAVANAVTTLPFVRAHSLICMKTLTGLLDRHTVERQLG